jgi:hypothetical protein
MQLARPTIRRGRVGQKRHRDRQNCLPHPYEAEPLLRTEIDTVPQRQRDARQFFGTKLAGSAACDCE